MSDLLEAYAMRVAVDAKLRSDAEAYYRRQKALRRDFIFSALIVIAAVAAMWVLL